MSKNAGCLPGGKGAILQIPDDQVDRGRITAQLAESSRVLTAMPLTVGQSLQERLGDAHLERRDPSA